MKKRKTFGLYGTSKKKTPKKAKKYTEAFYDEEDNYIEEYTEEPEESHMEGADSADAYEEAYMEDADSEDAYEEAYMEDADSADAYEEAYMEGADSEDAYEEAYMDSADSGDVYEEAYADSGAAYTEEYAGEHLIEESAAEEFEENEICETDTENDEYIVEYENASEFEYEEVQYDEALYYDSEDYAEDTESYYESEEYSEDTGEYYESEEYSEDTGEYYESEEYSDDYDEEDQEDSFDTAYGDIDGSHAEELSVFGPDLSDGTENLLDRMKGWISRMTAFDAILVSTGVALIVAAVVILSMFLETRRIDEQIAAIAPVGNDLTNVGIVGEEGLLAMADAALSGQLETELSEIFSSEESTETSKVNVSFVSVEKDLKIRFTDASTDELITGTAFEVVLTSSKGKELRLTDDDQDGIIYAENITPGVFDAVVTSTDKYKFPTTPQKVTVKEKVEYVVINVQDEVKKESQINVAAEDTQKQDAAKEEEKLVDTVEWVESTKTLISGTESYLLVDKNTIADPSQAAKAGARMLFDTLNVTLDKSSLSLSIGSSAELKGSAFADSVEGDTEYKYTTEWKSSNEGVASVNGGTVTAKAEGSTVITYTVTKKTITTTYEPKEVKEEILEISLDDYDELPAEEKKNCTPIKDDADQTIGYTYKKVTQPEKKVSETTETASASCEVTVESAKITSASLELSKSADSCNVAGTLTVKPSKLVYTKQGGSTETITDNFPSVSWSSSDPSVATVDAKGLVTGVKAGTVTITAKISGIKGADDKELDITASVSITVDAASALTLTLDRTKDVYINIGNTTTLVATVINYQSDAGVTWESSDKKIVTVDAKGVVTGVAVGSATITATTKEKGADGNPVKASCVVTVNSNASADTTTKLKDKNGNQIYIKDKDGNYKEAVYADYYTASEFYIRTEGQYRYTGWQTINGKQYYYDKNGNVVTGTQVIQGVTYNFGPDGAIATTVNGSKFGIDVSRHNGNIDWNAVKASGVDYVIIRCGYRGSATGVLIEDENFKKNIKGATAAGLKVGIYVFSQAINEVEAVKEASLAVSLAKGYNLTYPIFIDTESSGGRADKIDAATRTAVVNAFCQTVIAGGYQPGIYASKSWYETKLNMGAIGNYKIWLAQYAAAPTYKGRYDMWQYSSKGRISGISGNVDLNWSYLGY